MHACRSTLEDPTESRLTGFGFDFELIFLARKYGFRIERIPVALSHRHESKVRLVRDSLRMLLDVFRVLRFDQKLAYRIPRRCPVCFSPEVGTVTQIRKYVVRGCRRCKCRYLGEFPTDEELVQLYEADYFNSSHDTSRGYSSREQTPSSQRTNEKRLEVIREHLPSRSRILEVGAGTGLFGAVAGSEYEYTGIDLSAEAARSARAQGIDVYCASLGDFVNTGPSFDAVAMFHVFEHLADPHDTLARVKELLKPGGLLVLITPDTESLLCAVSGDRWVSYKFPEHLILYSRSALIELLEHSGFEIDSASADAEYVDHPFLLSRLEQLSPPLARLARFFLHFLPEPLPVPSGSIRIVARRRSGPPVLMKGIRTTEPTHAR